MEHPGFYHRAGPFSLGKIAAEAGAELAEPKYADKQVTDILPIQEAGSDHLSFLDNVRYLGELATTEAVACFIQPKYADRLPGGTAALLSPHPYRAYAKALAMFYPDAATPKVAAEGATGAAHIDPSAKLEPDVIVEPGVIIGPEVQIGEGTRIAAGAVIGYRCAIGRNCYIGARAVITHTLIGNHVIIHAGAAIGQDGFGFAMGAQGHLKVPQIGRVIIQDWVEIGANCAVDRGGLRDTIIGEGTKIDNLVQIAHNVVIGRNAVLAGQAGISGSTVLEDFVVMGGQSGTVGHIRIGAGTQIGGNSGVTSSLPPGQRVGGMPAKPIGEWAREVALMKRLANVLNGKRLKALIKMMD
jgi:UDP-3-O-[3-hydroxymyristoyl] glucosamine N-acyltransferase